MKKPSLKGLVIRTALVVQEDIGYIYACDLKKERAEVPHVIIFKWKSGDLARFEGNFNVHSACVIDKPYPGRLVSSEPGYYSVETRDGVTTGDIFEASAPAPKKRRVGGVRSVSSIAGKGYAVGYRGMVYRMDHLDRWTRIDEGLPDDFDIDAIHGFSDSDIYAAGSSGGLWHFNGKKWKKRELPTNLNLNAVKCAGNDEVYVAGCEGILLRGRDDSWEVIEHGETEEDIWDIEWFDGCVYISTLDYVYRLKGDRLESVDFGKDAPRSCYQLSAAKGVMWSNGEYDIMAFDGSRWSRIV